MVLDLFAFERKQGVVCGLGREGPGRQCIPLIDHQVEVERFCDVAVDYKL